MDYRANNNDGLPEKQGIESLSAFRRLSTSSVRSTIVGSVGFGCPRIGGRVRDTCELYQEVPTRMAWASSQQVIYICGTGLLTPIIAVVRGFTHFTDHGRFSALDEIAVLYKIMTLTIEIHYKISRYVSHPSSLTP